jgi:hypothetical protein
MLFLQFKQVSVREGRTMDVLKVRNLMNKQFYEQPVSHNLVAQVIRDSIVRARHGIHPVP